MGSFQARPKKTICKYAAVSKSGILPTSNRVICVQSAQAKAEEQSAADYAALAEARKELGTLRKQVAVLESKFLKPPGRGKGKNLGHVYDGEDLKRDRPPAGSDAVRCQHCQEVIDAQVNAYVQVCNLLLCSELSAVCTCIVVYALWGLSCLQNGVHIL